MENVITKSDVISLDANKHDSSLISHPFFSSTADAKVIQYFNSSILFQTLTGIFIIINCVLVWAAFVIELQIRTHGIVSRQGQKESTLRRTNVKTSQEDRQDPASPVASSSSQPDVMTTTVDIEQNGRTSGQSTQVNVDTNELEPILLSNEDNLQEEDEDLIDDENDNTRRLIA